MTVYTVTPPTRAPSFKVVPLGDLATTNVPPPRFVIDQIAPRSEVTLLGAHGGAGKSILSLVLGAHVAAGRGWGPYSAIMGKVVYLSMEDRAEVVRHRMRKICTRYELDPEAVAQNMAVLDGTDSDPLAVEIMTDGIRHMSKTDAYEELAEACKGADLVIVDNGSDAYAGNENDRSQVRCFMRQLLGRIARDADAALVLLAHLDKAAAKFGSNGNSYSGSTAWHNSARSRLALLTDPDGGLQLVQEKSTHGKIADPVAIRWTDDGVPMPIDEADTKAIQAAAATEDAEHVAAAIEAAHAAGVSVSTARSGNYSARHSLATFDLPRELTAGKADRFWRALDVLLAARRIVVESYQTDWRKTRQRYVPAAPVVCAAPVPPYPPELAQAQGAPLRQLEPEPNRRTTGATGALAQPDQDDTELVAQLVADLGARS